MIFCLTLVKYCTGYLMHYARFVLLAVPFVIITALAFAQYSSPPSGPGVDQLCKECGVIFEIQEIASERAFARTLEEQASPAGATINIPLGRKSDNRAQLGVYGTRDMRSQLEERSYEIVIRYDDDRFTRREVSDVTGLYVGARVRVYQDYIEPYDRN
jgi:hypothetical protein